MGDWHFVVRGPGLGLKKMRNHFMGILVGEMQH